jgi:hypothetical protein
MPVTSKRQFRAMQAAKAGKSNIGIPESVGKDFVSATPTTKGLPETAKKKKKGRDYAFTK